MSKSRRRDPRRNEPRLPGAGRRELIRPQQAPPSTWSLRDKLNVGAGIAVALLAFFSPVILREMGQHRLISRRLESWRAEFGLKDDQVKKLQEIEYGFHGSGNPFFDHEPSATEIEIHDKQVVAAMGQEAGKRYLAKISGTNH